MVSSRQNSSKCLLQLGLGSIGPTSMDRQSRKIDVQHERTSIAELDTAPPTSIVFPTPKLRDYPILLKDRGAEPATDGRH